MTFRVLTADQRSEEWRQARAGRLTGSRACDMLATIKSGEAAARRDYRTQLVTERLTGQPQDDTFVNAAMQRGIDVEPLALAAYEDISGKLARKTGFLFAAELMVGCSLDGDIDNFTGILELKCPKSATHFRYLRDGKVPPDYVPQITHNLWVSGAQWCDFLSFDDRFPVNLRTFLIRVHRADVDIAAYEAKAKAFLDEVDREEAAARGWSVLGATA